MKTERHPESYEGISIEIILQFFHPTPPELLNSWLRVIS
jgi:hypothetical protein